MNRPTVVHFFTLAVLCGGTARAETAAVEWIRQIGTSTLDASRSVAVDAAGNVYISGSTYGSLSAANAGLEDAFLSKFDSSGNELWTRQIGTSRSDSSLSVAVDAAGNAYISGYTRGSLGGVNAGLADAFLTKFDSSGNKLWTEQIGTSGDDVSSSVAVDTAGNAYISGRTAGSLGAANAGYLDAFLVKFDSMGNVLWSEQIGTGSSDLSQSAAVDAAGNVYISGRTHGGLGGGNEGSWDAFVAKFDSSGNQLWSQQIGTSTEDSSYSVAVDAAGNAFITGSTSGSLGGPNLGGNDAFLTKFDSSGSALWTEQIGASSVDQSFSVAVDAAGNAVITGTTLGDANAGAEDVFLIKFDSNGKEVWTEQIGTSSSDESRSVKLDASGNVYISGFTEGSLGGSNVGRRDAFLIKYRIVPEPTAAVLAAVAGVAGLGVRRRG